MGRRGKQPTELSLTGVYGIKNLLNNSIYIGSASKSFGRRWWTHKKELYANRHVNRHLQNAWNKYGEHNFKFFIIEVIDGNRECILAAEQFYLDIYFGQDFCYNINPRATGGLGREKGFCVSEETKAKQSASQKAARLYRGTAKKSVIKKDVGRPMTDPMLEEFVVYIKAFFPNLPLRKIAGLLNNKVGYVTVKLILDRNTLPEVRPISFTQKVIDMEETRRILYERIVGHQKDIRFYSITQLNNLKITEPIPLLEYKPFV